MTDPTRRALRTLFQVSLVTGILQLLIAFGVPLTTQQQAAIIVVATPIVVFVQNLLEDSVAAFPAVLKAPASGGQNPVPDPPKAVEPTPGIPPGD